MAVPAVPDRAIETLVAAELGEAERVALAYAPARARAGFAAVLALDAVLISNAATGSGPDTKESS